MWWGLERKFIINNVVRCILKALSYSAEFPHFDFKISERFTCYRNKEVSNKGKKIIRNTNCSWEHDSVLPNLNTRSNMLKYSDENHKIPSCRKLRMSFTFMSSYCQFNSFQHQEKGNSIHLWCKGYLRTEIK